MDNFILGAGVGALVVSALLSMTAAGNMRGDAMVEAFERGYAVRCPGAHGYHWECE